MYRLAPAAIARLGYAPRRWRGPGYIAHTLDAVEAVCAMVRSSDPEAQPKVLRRLPESIVVDGLLGGPAAGLPSTWAKRFIEAGSAAEPA